MRHRRYIDWYFPEVAQALACDVFNLNRQPAFPIATGSAGWNPIKSE